MNLYYIHCGFYDREFSEGLYEFHINIPIVASSLDEAKSKVRCDSLFTKKSMHIDGIQEIKLVNGYHLELIPVKDLDQSIVLNHLHRDL